MERIKWRSKSLVFVEWTVANLIPRSLRPLPTIRGCDDLSGCPSPRRAAVCQVCVRVKSASVPSPFLSEMED